MVDDFEEFPNYWDIYDRLDIIFGLNQSSGYHIKTISDGKMEFQIWNLDVDIRDAPLASGDRGDSRFEADSSISLKCQYPLEEDFFPVWI